jgi:hypothetical protein
VDAKLTLQTLRDDISLRITYASTTVIIHSQPREQFVSDDENDDAKYILCDVD